MGYVRFVDADERATLRRTTDSHTPIKGRRWRRTDPGLDETTRQHLVNELMTARRMVKSAQGDETATADARSRVHDAKVALGERGPTWWEDQTVDDVESRATALMRTMERSTGDVLSIDDAIRLIGIDPVEPGTADDDHDDDDDAHEDASASTDSSAGAGASVAG